MYIIFSHSFRDEFHSDEFIKLTPDIENYSILDTEDGVLEWYSYEEVMKIIKQVKISNVVEQNGNLYVRYEPCNKFPKYGIFLVRESATEYVLHIARHNVYSFEFLPKRTKKDANKICVDYIGRYRSDDYGFNEGVDGDYDEYLEANEWDEKTGTYNTHQMSVIDRHVFPDSVLVYGKGSVKIEPYGWKSLLRVESVNIAYIEKCEGWKDGTFAGNVVLRVELTNVREIKEDSIGTKKVRIYYDLFLCFYFDGKKCCADFNNMYGNEIECSGITVKSNNGMILPKDGLITVNNNDYRYRLE